MQQYNPLNDDKVLQTLRHDEILLFMLKAIFETDYGTFKEEKLEKNESIEADKLIDVKENSPFKPL
jgi:hypothetical protein